MIDYRETEERMNALLDTIVTFSPTQRTAIKEYIEVNEFLLAFETLCDVIFEDGIVIDGAMYHAISTAGQSIGADSEYWERLNPDRER